MKINQGAEPEMRRGCGSEILIRAGGHGGVPEVVQVLKGESRFPPRLATPNPTPFSLPDIRRWVVPGWRECSLHPPRGGGERGGVGERRRRNATGRRRKRWKTERKE